MHQRFVDWHESLTDPLSVAAANWLAQARHDLDAGAPQPRVSATCHLLVGIVDRRHDPRDARVDQGGGARRGVAVMVARLERRIDGRAPGPSARCSE